MIKMANLLDFNLGGIQVMDIKKIIEWRKKNEKADGSLSWKIKTLCKNYSQETE